MKQPDEVLNEFKEKRLQQQREEFRESIQKIVGELDSFEIEILPEGRWAWTWDEQHRFTWDNGTFCIERDLGKEWLSVPLYRFDGRAFEVHLAWLDDFATADFWRRQWLKRHQDSYVVGDRKRKQK